MHDARDGGQADARALELLRLVQALEGGEQPVGVLHVEADAVVPHKKHDFPALCFAAERDLRRGFAA